MPPANGIVHTGSPDASTLEDRKYLLLEEMRAKVLIIDIAARVTLTQVYRNPLGTPTSRAVYYFPVPASGAICAFEMKTSDDRVVTAICIEKDQARQEYEQALAQGQESSLLEWVADDVFTISVGSIPAKSTVTVKLVFTMTLPNDDGVDEIRFQLPMCVGERYGPPIPGLAGAVAPSSSTRIRITFEIQTSGRLQNITSPSHPADITEVKYQTHLNRPSRRRTTVRYRSPIFLERDFILVVHSEGLDTPRCFAELQRDSRGHHSDTVAMQLSLVPKIKLPPVQGQEYIFLVDRSGSMANARIETAKRTLKLLLRMLPSRSSTFNIFSFGSHHDGLWPGGSKLYDHNTLSEASVHVSSMDADYGGTEIRAALNGVFAARNAGVATAVFVLTDGDVSEPESVITDIGTAVRASHSAGSHCRLRVFCLGIGDGVSSAMCEGIARAGEGICLFAVHTESILGKCAKLFRAGRKNFVNNVSIDWGIPDENLSMRSTVNFSTPRSSPRKVRLRPAPAVQQSPALVADLHAETRINVYAILTLRKTTVPKEVIVRGELDGGGHWELTVPIRGIQLADAEPGLPLVHTLAAWQLIQGHQERTQPLAPAIGNPSEEEIRKASIVRLGERYQVASRHTSFVAVDTEAATQRPTRRVRTPPSPTPPPRPRPRSRTPPRNGLRAVLHRLFNPNVIPKKPVDPPVEPELEDEEDVPKDEADLEDEEGVLENETDVPEDDVDDLEDYVNVSVGDVDVPGAWPGSVAGDAPDEGYASEPSRSFRTFSTLSSLEEHTSVSEWSEWSVRPPPLSEEDVRMMRSPSPKLEPERLAPRGGQRRNIIAPPPRAAPLPPPPPIDPKVIELAELQLFDGSFDGAIRAVVGRDVLNSAEVAALRVDSKRWATAVAIAFMSKHLADPAQKDLLNDLLEKAYDFLGGENDSSVQRIVKRARELV